jgi:hypothetical protein
VKKEVESREVGKSDRDSRKIEREREMAERADIQEGKLERKQFGNLFSWIARAPRRRLLETFPRDTRGGGQ